LYTQPSLSSSSTLVNLYRPSSSDILEAAAIPIQRQKSSMTLESSKRLSNNSERSEVKKITSYNVPLAPTNTATNSRFDAPFNTAISPVNSIAQQYKPHLTPNPSPLRPHCLAKDRLRLWLP
ncbi:hypothetical protein BJ138DRAFT_993052, partial [Hygrophoropsis aurantiaca]